MKKIYDVLMKEEHHWIFDLMYENVMINVKDIQEILHNDNQEMKKN
jgi:hypothetical protein